MAYGTGFLPDKNYDGIPTIIVGAVPFIINFIIFSIKIYLSILKYRKKNSNKLDEAPPVIMEEG